MTLSLLGTFANYHYVHVGRRDAVWLFLTGQFEAWSFLIGQCDAWSFLIGQWDAWSFLIFQFKARSLLIGQLKVGTFWQGSFHCDILTKSFFSTRFCGLNIPKDPFISEDHGTVLLLFRSTASSWNAGFKVRFRAGESHSYSLKH